VIAPGVEDDMADLLAGAGCTVRGRNRADCPRCGGKRTVSYTAEVFCCHHAAGADCDFRGNAFTLARELGLARQLSRAEARALGRERERAEAVAKAFTARCQAARFGLGALHIELLNLQDDAHERLKAKRDDEMAWEKLAYIYTELPRIRAELALLGDGTVGDRVVWLEADDGKRREMAGRILQVGGVPTYDGKWAEVGNAAPVQRDSIRARLLGCRTEGTRQ